MDCKQPWEVFNLLTMRNRSSGTRCYEYLSGVEVEVVEVVTPRWTSLPHSLIVTYYCCSQSACLDGGQNIFSLTQSIHEYLIVTTDRSH